jgi:hypothetical protein
METTFLKIPYPDESADPFWDTYEAQMSAIDQSMFMCKIQCNLFVGGGGVVSFSPGTQTLSWTSDFIVPVYHYGYKITVPYGADNVTRSAIIPDGYAIVVEIPYTMTANVVAEMKIISQLTPANHAQWVLGWRTGNKVYFKGMSPVGT